MKRKMKMIQMQKGAMKMLLESNLNEPVLLCEFSPWYKNPKDEGSEFSVISRGEILSLGVKANTVGSLGVALEVNAVFDVEVNSSSRGVNFILIPVSELFD
jgi:hypothetical protein